MFCKLSLSLYLMFGLDFGFTVRYYIYKLKSENEKSLSPAKNEALA